MQMAAGSGSELRAIFDEYLAKWRYTDDEVYVLNGGQEISLNGFVVTPVMSTKQYHEVAELYTVTFLCIVSQDSETAISWAEKAELSEQGRQVLLFFGHIFLIIAISARQPWMFKISDHFLARSGFFFFKKKVYESCFHAGLGFYSFPNNFYANLMQTLILLSEIPRHYSVFSGKICCCTPFHLVAS